jgi:hypothetical protein
MKCLFSEKYPLDSEEHHHLTVQDSRRDYLAYGKDNSRDKNNGDDNTHDYHQVRK